MAKERGNSTGNKGGNEKKSLPINVTVISIIFAFVVLFVLVVILGWSFFTDTMEQNKDETISYVIFALIGAAVSNLSSALTSHLSHKTEKKKEDDMVERISKIFADKTGEITKKVSVAVKQNNLVSGNRNDILRLSMNQSSLNGEIKRIRIFAHESSTFAKYFKAHFEKKSFDCIQLDILVHNPAIQNENHPLIADWITLYNNTNTKIATLRIRNPESEKRRSFYGMVIEFTHHHSIGMIGFYRPPYKSDDSIIPFNTSYGVFSESSILDVLDEYFEYYWSIAKPVADRLDPCN